MVTHETAGTGRQGNGSIIHAEGEGYCMGVWQNTTIVAWSTVAQLSHTAILEKMTTEFIASHPEGISAIHIVATGSPLPDSTVRSEFTRLAAKFADNLACVGTVVEGSGFWASAMHSLITSLQWMSRRPFKSKIVSTLSDLAEWLPAPHAERTGVKLAPAEFVSVMSSFMERVR